MSLTGDGSAFFSKDLGYSQFLWVYIWVISKEVSFVPLLTNRQVTSKMFRVRLHFSHVSNKPSWRNEKMLH